MMKWSRNRERAALPLPLAGEGWGGGVAASHRVERAPTRRALARKCAAERVDLRASFARLDPASGRRVNHYRKGVRMIWNRRIAILLIVGVFIGFPAARAAELSGGVIRIGIINDQTGPLSD